MAESNQHQQESRAGSGEEPGRRFYRARVAQGRGCGIKLKEGLMGEAAMTGSPLREAEKAKLRAEIWTGREGCQDAPRAVRCG